MAQISPVSGAGGGGGDQGAGFQGSLDRANGNSGDQGGGNPAMEALSKTLPGFFVQTMMRQKDINPIAKEAIDEGRGSED